MFKYNTIFFNDTFILKTNGLKYNHNNIYLKYKHFICNVFMMYLLVCILEELMVCINNW
jgi:hypothetical protein